MYSNEFSSAQIILALFLYFSYIGLWLLMVRERDFKHDLKLRMALLCILCVIVLAIYFTVPLSFNSILMGIISGALPYYMSVRRALVIGTIASFPLYFVFTYYWQNDFVFLSASLFWTFNMFAIIMVNATVNEKLAREKAEESNRQLVTTQALLREASKQSERVRIARNIHDLLGHHLTALTINLQVASIKTEGDVKQNIEQCHQLAKLLLSDVREAVSDIRDKSQVDLRAAIQTMAEQVPWLNIDLDFSDDLRIDDIGIADTLMKCIQESITNTIKHGKGENISISVSQLDEDVKLRIESEGNMPDNLVPGNGLKGMQERVALLKGKINFILQPQSLITEIFIPCRDEALS
jgi:signal transduction histidine kinase